MAHPRPRNLTLSKFKVLRDNGNYKHYYLDEYLHLLSKIYLNTDSNKDVSKEEYFG